MDIPNSSYRYPVIPVVLLLLLAGCAGDRGFNRQEMTGAADRSQPFLESQMSVEQIGQLRAQVHLPLKLAVAPPVISYGRRWGGKESNNWSPDEIREIESWAYPLKKAGIISDLIVLPAFLVEECRENDPACIRTASRSAAARAQADALLVISLASAVDKYTNQASLLDITILGLWLIPGHHRDALTIAEGAMIDNRTEYLFAFARGEAEEKTVRPYIYANSWKAVKPSRLRALQAFGKEFIKEAMKLKHK
ncbi:MAG TPA: hypothetical protein VMJ66_16215 [Geobacteraceae bacterium]|nr:hypothetical protein [Geobacteraceae bacterium]